MHRPSQRVLAPAALLAAALALLFTGSSASRAQQSAANQARTPAETEALETLSNGLLISARTQAEAILRRNANSIVGHYVLGRVYFDAEGSLARAMYHLGRARELLENGAVGDPASSFHQELLYTTARLAGQMELHEFQLELLGYHDHLYDPDMIAERCWPLMKLGRMDEARQFAQTAVGSPNPWQRSAGLNAMCAVEGEARTRGPYRSACLAALEDARSTVARARARGDDEEEAGGIAVDAYNATLASLAALDFGEAESLAHEGVRRFESSPANPWRVLVELYLSEGLMESALEAFGQMVHWNERQPAALRDQSRADIEATVALVYLFAGENEQALMRIDRALARPDRRGLTTDGAEQARGRHALMRRMIRRSLREEQAEQASWSGLGARLWQAAGSLGRGLETWPDEERIVGVLSDEGRLRDTLRPYVPGGIDNLSPWMVGDLIEVLGPAVVAVGLEAAERADTDEARTRGYYLAIRAEIAAARGEERRALRLLEEATPLLSDAGWTLVRARTTAVVAHALEEDGRYARANELFGTAITEDPSVFRRLGISLPARVHGGPTGLASEAADLLSQSPRFHERSSGFEVDVTGDGNELRACLRTPNGNEIRCATARPPEPREDAEAAERDSDDDEQEALSLPQRLAEEFHQQIFGTRLMLSSVDLTSLDGRTNGGSALANERLRELMNQPSP